MNILKRIFGRKPPSEFWMKFTRAVHQRGCVAYMQNANSTGLNNAGILETIVEEGGTTKIILLPGDDHSAITEENLVGFEPLNRKYRKMLEKERSTLAMKIKKK